MIPRRSFLFNHRESVNFGVCDDLGPAAKEELPARAQDVLDRELKADGEQEEDHADIREAFDDLSGLGLYFTTEAVPERGTTSLQHLPHVRNFLDCMKSRQLPAGDIEIGHKSTVPCLIGNIAHRVGQKLLWDAKLEKFSNNPQANSLLSRPYRKPWDDVLRSFKL